MTWEEYPECWRDVRWRSLAGVPRAVLLHLRDDAEELGDLHAAFMVQEELEVRQLLDWWTEDGHERS